MRRSTLSAIGLQRFAVWLVAEKLKRQKRIVPSPTRSMPTETMNTPTMIDAQTIITKFPYPAFEGEANPAEEEEIAMYKATGDGCLQHLLAMTSDCVYHYELDDDFHDGDMKMAYLTMKKAWESGGDTKPFMATICRNRKALTWANIMLIWLMVLPRNDAYWGDANLFDLPEGMPERKKEMMKELLTHFRNFRNNWKQLHEQKRISRMLVAYGKDGYEFALYGKKTPKEETKEEDPSA